MSKPAFSGQWMPWFHGDFLKATQGWTVTERGVYFLLLGASWEMGPLPDDRRRLAGIVGAQLDEFDQAWAIVRPKFELTEQGLINQRLEVHRERQALRSEKARQSIMTRWNSKASDLDTDVHTDESNSNPKSDTYHLRSGYSSDLRSQISEKGKILELKPPRAKARAVSPEFHEQVKAAYHRLCPELPAVKIWTEKRRKLLDDRIVERCLDGKSADAIEYWEKFFEKVAASSFLCGATGFRADLQWLLHPDNFVKVIEGRYENRAASNGARAHV